MFLSFFVITEQAWAEASAKNKVVANSQSNQPNVRKIHRITKFKQYFEDKLEIYQWIFFEIKKTNSAAQNSKLSNENQLFNSEALELTTNETVERSTKYFQFVSDLAQLKKIKLVESERIGQKYSIPQTIIQKTLRVLEYENKNPKIKEVIEKCDNEYSKDCINGVKDLGTL